MFCSRSVHHELEINFILPDATSKCLIQQVILSLFSLSRPECHCDSPQPYHSSPIRIIKPWKHLIFLRLWRSHEGLLRSFLYYMDHAHHLFCLCIGFSEAKAGEILGRLHFNWICPPFGGSLHVIFILIRPIIFNAYDYNNNYCWFREDTTSLGFWLRMGYYFIPLWILFIANMAFALSTHWYLKTIQLSEDVLRVFNRLILFPFILFFTGIIATVDVIYTYSTKD